MKKIYKLLFTGAVCMAAITACKKTTVDPVPMGDAGSTVVRLMGDDYETEYPGGYQFITLESGVTLQTADFIEVRRMLPNNDELNKELTVVVRQDDGAITDFNNIHGSAFVPFPSAAFTANSANPQVGSDFSVTFKPGEFSKFIKLDVGDLSGIDFSKQYAMGFTLVSAGGNAKVTEDVMLDTAKNISSHNKTVVVEVGFKNKWDGIYQLRGYILRAGDASATGTVGPKEIGLMSTGPYTVKFDRTHGWANQATIGIAASVATPTYTIDPATNLVTITSDGGAFPNGLTNLGPYVSRYDPASKTFYCYATWSGGAGNREMLDTLVYLRPR